MQLVAVAALLELLVALLLHFPTRVPALRDLARRYYGTFDRAIIQMDPRFARYDPELFYTLRPGRFTFAEREFALTGYTFIFKTVGNRTMPNGDQEVKAFFDERPQLWGLLRVCVK